MYTNLRNILILCYACIVPLAYQLCKLGLRLGIELLRGGNRVVQDAMYNALKSGEDRAFDGCGTAWMPAIRARLRCGIKDIDERKM